MDVVDLLNDLVVRFGHALLVLDSQGPAFQKTVLGALVPLLNHARPAVRKRTSTALGSLSLHLTDDMFQLLVGELIQQCSAKCKSQDYEKLVTVVGCLAQLTRYGSSRLLGLMDKILVATLDYTELENDDLREQCLQVLFESLTIGSGNLRDSHSIWSPTFARPYYPSCPNKSQV